MSNSARLRRIEEAILELINLAIDSSEHTWHRDFDRVKEIRSEINQEHLEEETKKPSV